MLGAGSLTDVLGWLPGDRRCPARPDAVAAGPGSAGPGRRRRPGRRAAALEIAAAGGHHLLLVGPPGTGKTMLAQRLRRPAAPARPPTEALQLAAIRSVAGRLPQPAR